MVRSGQTVVVLADSSKANNDYLVRFAELSDVDVLVTDTHLSEADRAALTDQGIEVVLA